ncbi:MAG: hypothetical protein AB7G75_12220 [Candidatus Binatia bacterium]
MQLLREGYHERLFLLPGKRAGRVVRKQAKSEENDTLLTEINWLEELPRTTRRSFPRVLRSRKAWEGEQAVFYDMPYFDEEWGLLSDLILTQTVDRESALALMGRVMEVMSEEIYPVTYPEEAHAYPGRLVALLERCLLRIPALPAFQPFIVADTIRLNGVECQNVFPLFEQIKADPCLRASLQPVTMCKVHGDLYPENVLVRLSTLRHRRPHVMILDPIAAIGLSRGDFAMDIAKYKSWLSTELPALRLGLFSIEQERRAIPAFTFSLDRKDERLQVLGDGYLLREFLQLFQTTPWGQSLSAEDPSWWQRVSFYEALYALSMVPLVPPWQSLARFLVGVQHLHTFISASRVDGLSVARRPPASLNCMLATDY